MRTAPSADRAIAVVTAVGSDPSRGLTLNEITRRTGYPKSTCHSVIASLVEARWLVRHPIGPTYRLGPAFIALADAGSRNFPALPLAGRALLEICEKHATMGTVTARTGAEIAVLAKVGSASPLAINVSVGQRIPFSPPLAATFLAWTEPSRLGIEVTNLPADRRRRYLASLTAIRRRGFAVALGSRAGEQLRQALAAEAAHGRTGEENLSLVLADLDREGYQALALHPTRWYPVSHISAPVFKGDGTVAMAINLIALPVTMTGRQITDLGLELRAAADRVTVEGLGRLPLDGSGSGATNDVG
jgi:DNA-binding IclR family transcriptional regulator